MRRFVPEGELIPAGYGLAWIAVERRGGMYFLVPLNYPARWLRSWWLMVTMPKQLRMDLWNCGEHGLAFARGVRLGREIEIERSRR